MRIGKRSTHIGITLICTDCKCTLRSDSKVHARHRDIGTEELFAQVLTRLVSEVCRVGIALFGREFRLEKLAHLLALDVDCRQDNMTRCALHQLHDTLTQVTLDNLHATRLQVWCKVALLCQHRLRLNQVFRTSRLDNLGHDSVHLFTRLCPMDLDAIASSITLELLEIVCQVRQGVLLNLRRLLAQLFPLRQRVGLTVTLLAHCIERLIVPRCTLLIL